MYVCIYISLIYVCDSILYTVHIYYIYVHITTHSEACDSTSHHPGWTVEPAGDEAQRPI